MSIAAFETADECFTVSDRRRDRSQPREAATTSCASPPTRRRITRACEFAAAPHCNDLYVEGPSELTQKTHHARVDSHSEPFFDFCIGIDGKRIDPDTAQDAAGAGLGAWKGLEEREGTQVILNVWNSKRQEVRGESTACGRITCVGFVPFTSRSSHAPALNSRTKDVPVVPSREWSSVGSSSSSAQPSLLGLSLRFCDPSHSLTHVWHILDILEGSPAESAGLVPYGDFIIGWTGGALRGEGEFYELIEAHADKALRLYVYNADYDHTREVIIVPNREWGGEGLLGCGVGYGLLHRIPRPSEEARKQAQQLLDERYEDADDRSSLSGGTGGAGGQMFTTPRMGGSNPSFQDLYSTPTQQPQQQQHQQQQNGRAGTGGAGGPPRIAIQAATPMRSRGEGIPEAVEEEEEDEDGHAGDHSHGVTVSMRQEEEADEDEDDELL